jgi:hypothetical protein
VEEMKEIKSPHNLISVGTTIFLAGSIEMGVAEDWQSKVTDEVRKFECTIFNPRREEWDSSWKQEQGQDQFNEQVNWELENLEKSDIVFLYLAPGTKSPISLLELGLHATGGKMIVVCPEGFWRKGNVDIVCTRHQIPSYTTLEEGIGALKTKIRQLGGNKAFNI